LSKILEERRASKDNYEDMLGCLMKGNDDRCKLNDEELIDLIITIMYSGYETISTTSMMAVKYLHDHPKVLEEMRVCAKVLIIIAFFFIEFFYYKVLMITLNIGIGQKEHFAIRERKKPEDPIDCNDLKSMRFTRAVRSVL
jgi:brassinosteroid-6-oxidase 2